jgi:hypothetical protein
MKLNATLSKLLTNKMVLNVIFVISVLNVIGYLMLGNVNAVIMFTLISFLISYFSKNMIIILGAPLILVNLIVMGQATREGFEKKDAEKDATKDAAKKDKKDKSSKEKPTDPDLPITPLEDVDTSIDESFEVGRKKGGKYNVDYASTVEDAYDELNKIIGGDGIQKLTGDTQNLMKQQLQLAEAMKSMGPIIQGMAPMMKQAQGLLEGMGSENGLGNIAALAKQFTAGAAKQ